MNKRIRTALVTTAVIGGGLFGVSQVAGTVSAQTDDTVTTTEQVTDATTDAPTDAIDREGCDRPEGAGGPFGARGPRGDRAAHAEETAALLGIDVEELRAALEGGDTLADIATANGVDPQTIIDAEVAEATERLAAAVDEGRLTEDEAADKLAEVTDRITTRVNEGRPERPEPADAAIDATGS